MTNRLIEHITVEESTRLQWINHLANAPHQDHRTRTGSLSIRGKNQQNHSHDVGKPGIHVYDNVTTVQTARTEIRLLLKESATQTE